MTKKQIRARKRNWLIMRLMGARSIFTHENIKFMEDTIKEGESYDCVYFCKDAIDDLIAAMRRT